MSKRVIVAENLLFSGLHSVPGSTVNILNPGTSSFVTHKTDYSSLGTFSGVLDGINTIFSTSVPFDSSTLAIYVNGVRQTVTTDYTLTGASQITFIIAPTSDSILIADYNEL